MKTPICVLFIVFISVSSSRSSVIVPSGETSSTTIAKTATSFTLQGTTSLPVGNGNANRALARGTESSILGETREKLISTGASNVDLMQPRVDNGIPPQINVTETNENKPDKAAGCNVKNGKCVPTREELIAGGVSNVDIVQHKVEFRPDQFKIDEPLEKKALDTTLHGSDKKTGCNVKNSTCVPTRDELIAAGVSNVDMMQHKVEFRPEQFKINEPLEKKALDTTVNGSDKKTGCNVKNSTCDPTRDELIAAGVSNVDMMQHKVEFRPEQFKINEPLEKKALDTTVNGSDKKTGCNVKNSTCVPTRDELIAAGVSNVDMMQHKVEFRPEQFKINEPLEKKALDTTVNGSDKKTGCNVKNSTCVPTRDELIAAGVSNVDMMQHKVEFRPEQFQLDTNVNESDKKTGCNVKNSTCVPTEKELITAGVNTNEFVGQFSLDNENIFLGQFKRNVTKSEEATAMATDVSSAAIDSVNNDSNTLLQKEMGTGNIGIVEVPAEESTETTKSATAQQIPAPGPTTQQTKSITKSAADDKTPTTDVAESKIEIPQQTPGENKTSFKEAAKQSTTSAVISERATSAQTTEAKTEFQTCPQLTCPKPCKYGRKVNSDGCEICECKFSDDCPRVLPTPRLLCLLQRTTRGCTSNTDCRRNRICCPGTCGPTCRRASRSRSMLLSMLND